MANTDIRRIPAFFLAIMVAAVAALGLGTMGGCQDPEAAVSAVRDQTAPRLDALAAEIRRHDAAAEELRTLIATIETTAASFGIGVDRLPPEWRQRYDSALEALDRRIELAELAERDAERIRAEADETIAKIRAAGEDRLAGTLHAVGGILGIVATAVEPTGLAGALIGVVAGIIAGTKKGKKTGEHEGAEKVAGSIAAARSKIPDFDRMFDDEEVARELRKALGDDENLRSAVVDANQKAGIR
ncbi:MAG: hypothetical protein EA379_00245 [Phycisphaerales bacterium]|nr:MAG: hypothetical protein EA379_00245 [Phycisphaerales bacterium]